MSEEFQHSLVQAIDDLTNQSERIADALEVLTRLMSSKPRLTTEGK